MVMDDDMENTMAQFEAEASEKAKQQKAAEGKKLPEDVKNDKDKESKEDLYADEEKDPNKSGFLAKAGIAGAIAVGATVAGAAYTRHKMQKGVDNLSNDIGGALFGKDLRRLPDISGITGIGDKDHQEYEY